MGSDAHVVVVGDPALLDTARRRIEALEATWSRFRPDSELCRLNAAAGSGPVAVSSDLALLVARALDGAEVTGGRFDPTQLAAVHRAGYVRSLELGPVVDLGPAPTADDRPLHERVVLDASTSTVRLATGTAVDPGGIGKGLAADLVSAELVGAGAAGALVNLGGDLRVRGMAPGGGAWTLEVDDPRPTTAGRGGWRVVIADGGVATSSRCRRRWTAPDGTERHHLIDPRTARPAATPALTATVVAAEAWQAEVLATAALLDGPRDDTGLGAVERTGAAALVLTESLDATSSRWERVAVRIAEEVAS